MKLVALALATLLFAGACSSLRGPAELVSDTGPVSALMPTAAGGLRYGELRTGAIREVTARGSLEPEPLAKLKVATEGQRGLLSMALSRENETFVSYTERKTGRLTVEKILPEPRRVVWEGPVSPDKAIGGHIAFLPDDRLVIGIGDLLKPGDKSKPGSVNGRILLLDPRREATQEPEVVGSGFNNPFAFASTQTGQIWIADNSPGSESEILSDVERKVTYEFEEKFVPSGLAAVADDLLVVCSFETGKLQRFRVSETSISPEGEPLVNDCKYGVTVLADGRIAYAAANSIRTVAIN